MEPPMPFNWTLVIIAVIGAVPGTIAAVFAGLALWRSSQNAKSIGVVDEKVNGMSHALVQATAGKNLAEGQLKERDAERIHRSEVTHTEDSPVKVKIVKPDIK